MIWGGACKSIQPLADNNAVSTWVNFLDRWFCRAVKFEPNQGHPARNWIGLTGDVASVIHNRGIGPRLA
jgi:hypothetical protein|tara:strand:+ start:86 stop:292 length:207 start_codon:yes stop_codon:yes gene_type:complete